jgi:hypothetical protein
MMKWRDRGIWETSMWFASNLPAIRVCYLPNTNVECYRHSNLFHVGHKECAILDYETHLVANIHPKRRSLRYEGVSKSFRTGRLERELQMVQLCTARCSCIAILWFSLVSVAAITLCVASQRVFIVVYFVIDSVRKILDIPSYFMSLQSRIINFHHQLHGLNRNGPFRPLNLKSNLLFK